MQFTIDLVFLWVYLLFNTNRKEEKMSSALQYDSYGKVRGALAELFSISGLGITKADGTISQNSIWEATHEKGRDLL